MGDRRTENINASQGRHVGVAGAMRMQSASFSIPAAISEHVVDAPNSRGSEEYTYGERPSGERDLRV